MQIILTHGKQSFESAQQSWSGEVAQTASQVAQLIDGGKFKYLLCNDQELFEVQDAEIYEQVKGKIQQWKDNPKLQSLEQSQFIRQVQYW